MNIDIEKAKKTAEALQYFGLAALAILAFLIAHWRAYKANRPRVQIAELKAEVESLRKMNRELALIVDANSTNIISLTDQTQGIVADAEIKIGKLRTDQDGRFVRLGMHDDLCDRVQALDDRLWEINGGAPRRRPVTKREGRHDPGD